MSGVMQEHWAYRAAVRTRVQLFGVNPLGNPSNLTPFEPGNVAALKAGLWSARTLDARAEEIVESLLEAPHVLPLDAVAARNVARLEALIRSCEEAIERSGVAGARSAADLLLRAVRRQTELLDRFGANPRARGTVGCARQDRPRE
jgi:hypothetical protein